MGSMAGKTWETPTIKLALRGEKKTTQRLPAERTIQKNTRAWNAKLNGFQVKL